MKVHCRSLLPINKLSNERNHIQVTVGVLSLSMEAERAPQWVSAGAQWQHLLLRMGWGKGGWACDMPMPSGGKGILPGNHLVARLRNRLKLTHKKNGSVVQWAPQSLRSVILAVHNLNENGTNLETASDSSFLSPFPFSVRQTQDLSHFYCSWFLLWNDLQLKKNICHYYYCWYVCVFVCMYMQEHIPWHACGEHEDNFPKFSRSAVGSGDEFRLSGSHGRCFPWLWATLEALLSNSFHGIYRAQKDPKSIAL